MSAPRSSTARRALLVLALVLAGGFVWTRILVARVEREFPVSGKFVDVGGARVHYVEKGQGTPIVLLHGVYGGAEDWRASIFDAVAQRGRAIAIDRPGHGCSESSSDAGCTPSSQARFVNAVLHELGIQRAVIVGFSWSGALAASYALQFPDETLGVLTINGALYEWDAISDVSDAVMGLPLLGPLFAHTVAMPIAQLLEHAGAERAFRPAAITSEFERAALRFDLRPSCLMANAAERRVLKPSLRAQSAHYGEIAVPLVIVAGLGDVVTHADFHSERLHAAVAGSELVTVPGAGHLICFSHPEPVLRALDTLLARVGTRR